LILECSLAIDELVIGFGDLVKAGARTSGGRGEGEMVCSGCGALSLWLGSMNEGPW